MSEPAVVEMTGATVDEHPATRAWLRLGAGRSAPTRVTALRETGKTAAYRLDGIGPRDAALVAKRSRRAIGAVERLVYEEMLPCLTVGALRYHGSIEEGDACWLFLEEAVGDPFSAAIEEHRRLAARWLALLHTSAARAAHPPLLPDRGPAHYLELLRAARRAIGESLDNPAHRASDRPVLDSMVARLGTIEARWDRVGQSCAELPTTLVHGDLQPKNVRVRGDGARHVLAVMDWETAGWGSPAADLASIATDAADPVVIDAYVAVAREWWPQANVRTLRGAIEAGAIFRQLDAIAWDIAGLRTRWPQRSAACIRVYLSTLTGAMRGAAWTR